MERIDNIYIVGFMGTGKTSAGRLAAPRLGLDFVDMDALIIEREKRSIPDIFRESGEPYFRTLEKVLVCELAQKGGMVISCGGGAFKDPDSVAVMKATGAVICLTSSPEVILERTKRYADRPLLKVEDPLGLIKELLKARQPAYGQAHCTIDTDNLSVEETAAAIVKVVKRHG